MASANPEPEPQPLGERQTLQPEGLRAKTQPRKECKAQTVNSPKPVINRVPHGSHKTLSLQDSNGKPKRQTLHRPKIGTP